MNKIPFSSIWRLIKIIAVIQIVNAVIDYFMWVAYGYLVPSWTIATLTVFYTILILAIKKAQENEAKTPDTEKKFLPLKTS